MKIAALNNITFQKKLMANSCILSEGKKVPCLIYELDVNNREDLRYFKALKGSDDWRDGTFFNDIENDMKSAIDGRYYVLENKSGACLGACEVYENDEKKSDDLIYLETTTTNSSQNKNRKTKYIGETLLSFVVGMAKRTNKKMFTVVDPTPFAYMFYIKHGFRENVFDENLSVKADDFEKVLSRNEEHVGKMEYIA